MIKLLAVFLLIVSTSSFSAPEEMIQVNRDYDREKLLKLFESENIPYKIINKNQIYYPISYREKVKSFTAKIWGPLDESKKGVTVNNNIAPKLAEELVKKGISFEVIHGDDISTFTWQTHFDKSAMKVVHEVVP